MPKQAKKITQAAADRKELINVLSGKPTEPSHAGLMYSKMDLIKALNHYADHYKPEDFQNWACVWASKNNLPALANKLANCRADDFVTFGALARMADRGFVHDQKTIDRMLTHFNGLVPAAKAKVKAAKPEKIVPMSSFDSLDASIDQILSGKKPDEPVLNFTEKAALTAIKDYCTKQLRQMDKYPEQFFYQTTVALRKLFHATLNRIKSGKVEVSKTKITRKRKTNPVKVVNAVKFQKEDAKLKLKSVNPLDVLERRKMYVYDTDKRRLIVFVSNAAGFTFTGTTLHNVDLAKSSMRTVRKPEALFKGRDLSISELNKAYNAMSGKALPLTTTRFNANFIILKVTAKDAAA